MLVIGISLLDVIVSTIYILIILFFAGLFRSYVTNSHTKKYFIPFVIVKIVFAILFVLVHSYHYQGGDTFLYFAGAKLIVNQIAYSPSRILEFLFGGTEAFNQIIYSSGFLSNELTNSSTLAMFQLTSVFYLLGFKQFMATTILMSMASAIGIWSIFSVLCKLYPKLSKLFAWGTLFYPTLCIWGSGILKDTLIVFAVGILFKSFYFIRNRKKLFLSILLILIGSILCLKLKPYILYTLLPPMLLWQYSAITTSLKNNFIRYTIAPFILLAFIGGGIFLLDSVSESAGKYSFDNVEEMAEGFQSWHTYLNQNRGQTGYSLGEVDYTPIGVLKKTPEAFFVTFYRPLPFEVSNTATAFESLQSTILLILTLYIFIKIGIFRFLKISFKNQHVRVFLIFAITLGIATGITSFNYGALSRYKIPILPFYTAALAIIYYEGKKLKAKKLDV